MNQDIYIGLSKKRGSLSVGRTTCIVHLDLLSEGSICFVLDISKYQEVVYDFSDQLSLLKALKQGFAILQNNGVETPWNPKYSLTVLLSCRCTVSHLNRLNQESMASLIPLAPL